jgi:23S rRNA pseudouridine2605 synthase
MPPNSPKQQRSPKRSAPRKAEAAAESTPSRERLQKVLAAAGLGSRRQCEELILAGRVQVDREFVTQLGSCVDAERQDIRVDGVRLTRRRRVYYLVNKPTGVVSTNRDPAGRQRVIDLVPPDAGLYCVGRLDRTSEGLILVTNDGDLANRLAHPRYGVSKTYEVEVAGRLTQDTLRRLQRGVRLAEAFVRMAEARIRRRRKQSTVLKVVLREGRNREIRRMLASVGHRVLRLKRVALGPLRLGDLPAGGYRRLETSELRKLRFAAERRGGSSAKKKTGPKGRRREPESTAAPAPRKVKRRVAKKRKEASSTARRGQKASATKPRSVKSAPRRKPAKKKGRS